MPRKKPPEKLYPAHYRLTRNQIRKVQQMGGAPWLRKLIEKTQASRHGRCPIEHVRAIKARNLRIVADPRPSKELVAEFKLSRQQINAIRRTHRVNPSAEITGTGDNEMKENEE